MSSQNLKKTDMIFGLCHTTDVEHCFPAVYAKQTKKNLLY